MRHAFLVFLLAMAFELQAQPTSNLPLHEYESFYSEFRREKIKTTLADFEARDSVKSIEWIYEAIPARTHARTEQHFSFSKKGRLTTYSSNDTADTSRKNEWNQYARSWTLHYNRAGQLDTLRVAEFEHGARTDLYWQNYNPNGYLTSAWKAGRNGCLAPTVIHYVYTQHDSFLSVTTRPFAEYDITGNVIGDSVHFTFDRLGHVTSERVFRFGGEEQIAFDWSDSCSFHYFIFGRSYMQESGERTCNAAGQLVRTTSSGYHINQQGTNFYSLQDSLVYNEWELISRLYRKSSVKTPSVPRELVLLPPDGKAQISNPSPPASPKPDFIYTYTVDGRGNWISRSHYTAEWLRIGYETRELVYY